VGSRALYMLAADNTTLPLVKEINQESTIKVVVYTLSYECPPAQTASKEVIVRLYYGSGFITVKQHVLNTKRSSKRHA